MGPVLCGGGCGLGAVPLGGSCSVGGGGPFVVGSGVDEPLTFLVVDDVPEDPALGGGPEAILESGPDVSESEPTFLEVMAE